MDEQKDLSVNNEDVLDNNNSSVNDEVPNVEENANTSNGSDDVRKAGNGYRGLASSNREAFSRGLSDNYNERIARNQANLNVSRANAANSKKEVETDDGVEEKDKSGLDRVKDKADVLKNKGELAASKIDKARAGMYAVTNPKEAAKMAIKAKVRTWILASIVPISIGLMALFVLFVGVLFVLGLFEFESQASGGSSVAMGGKECGFTISDTSLTKTEFKNKIQEYANSNSRWQVFVDNADDYYDYAKAKGVNPELVVLVAHKEGKGTTTGGANNYWGLECPNGAKVCGSYSSFMEGAKKLIDSASNYSTLREWFEVGSYSYIGYFWYNLYRNSSGEIVSVNWGDGGCAYAPYIYPDGIPERVKNACGSSTCEIGDNDLKYYNSWKQTGVNPRPECTPTLDEDQSAYTTYLINKAMGNPREEIFGLKLDEGVICSSNSVEGNGIHTGVMTHPCPEYVRVTSEFGYRNNPLGAGSEFHGGIDLSASEGTPIYAADGGVVTISKYSDSAGNYIIIDHDNGLQTVYMHMSKRVAVVGQKVSKGQLIGKVGTTGRSTGNHLHFEVRLNGEKVNPRDYVDF